MGDDNEKLHLAQRVTRRSFVQTTALTVAALYTPINTGMPTRDLEMDFERPPDSARMWTWWFWLGDRVDTQSITTDLEEMKAKGVGGVTVYSLEGPALGLSERGPGYMSPAWRELFKHTVDEAQRLGLGVSTMLCSGWNLGGPWINSELACKQYTHSELSVNGPQAFYDQLPQPPSDERFYRDVAVFAFRVNRNPAAQASAQQKAREDLFAWKSGKASYGTANTTPIREICEAVQRPLLVDDRGVVAAAIDVTKNCTPDGKLNWHVPEGDWKIVRFGYTLTSKTTTWSSPSGLGLEADPFAAQSMDVQFANIAMPLLREAGRLRGKIFGSVQIDSWESGLPNWTTNFLEQFRKYCGYDALPYLPALAGWIIGSYEITDRFLFDYRKTLGDSIADNYFGRLSQLAQEHGIIQQSEAGGVCYPGVMSMDALKNLGRCAVPMGEFWQDGAWQENGQNTNGKQTASAAHIYGKRIAAAEAFSSFLHWTDSPATLKPTADRAFCEGLNHFFIFSSATHTGDGIPGTEFAAGTHFNRKITWWNQARCFTDYVARCTHLLQQGMFVADVLFYNGDGCPNFVPPKHIDPSLGPGYDYDVCNTEVLMTRLSVRDGRIALPDGMSYRLLVLPERNSMPIEVIQKLKDLLAQGITLVGPPPEKALGLKDYPACDETIAAIATELWADCDGQKVKERKFKKGRLFWGITLREILTRDGIKPDFEYFGGQTDTFLDWIHRSDGASHIYFVANRNDRTEQVMCTFRVIGKRPEIWDPVTGEIRDALNLQQASGRTSFPVDFAPYQSLFIVFRERTTASRKKRLRNPRLSLLANITGPWKVRFDPKWGGPESAEFGDLRSWTDRPEEGIKYYSGTATYTTSFNFAGKPDQVLFLDLGEVKEIAEVRLNDENLGVAWTKPFRVEATGAVKVGENKIAIDVVNLWPNRLIRDGQLPSDKRLTTTNVKSYYEAQPGGHKLLDSGLLGPVRLMSGGPG